MNVNLEFFMNIALICDDNDKKLSSSILDIKNILYRDLDNRIKTKNNISENLNDLSTDLNYLNNSNEELKTASRFAYKVWTNTLMPNIIQNPLFKAFDDMNKIKSPSKLDVNISSIPITTIITNLGLIKIINKDGSIFYSGVKNGVNYTLHLPESEITKETALLLSFNGGGESGSKPGDFSKIHNSLGCGIIKEQPKVVQDKIVILAIQLFQNESLNRDIVREAADIIKTVQIETGIRKENTGSISHSIGGRFSAVLISENPELIGFAVIASPSKDRRSTGGENFYDFNKVKETLSNIDSEIKIIWGSGDGNKKDNGQSVAGVSNKILLELNAQPQIPSQEHFDLYGNKINVYNSENVEFIEMIGEGHGIGEAVAEASFDYFMNEYLRRQPQLISSTSTGGEI